MKNRHRSPYSPGVQLARVAWAVCQATLFRCSPRPLYRWRAWLLRRFGADVHRDARVHPTVKIQFPWNVSIGANSAIGDAAIIYALGSVEIGRRVTISQYAYLCAGTHDYRTVDMPLQRSPITIEDDVWIAAGAFVGPGVTVHEGAILAAQGAAAKDLDAWMIYGGNPAAVIKPRPPLQDHDQPDRPCQTDLPDAEAV